MSFFNPEAFDDSFFCFFLINVKLIKNKS